MFLILLWSAGFALFSGHVNTMTEPGIKHPVQAVIVLTGGTGRIESGLELLATQKVSTLYITGVHKNVSMSDIRNLWQGSEPLPECCIELGYMATNTFQNAEETKTWLDKNPDIKNVILLTSNYHMPRALLEYKHMLPELTIIPYPVKPQRNNPEQEEHIANLLFREYHKSIYTYIRQLFFD